MRIFKNRVRRDGDLHLYDVAILRPAAEGYDEAMELRFINPCELLTGAIAWPVQRARSGGPPSPSWPRAVSLHYSEALVAEKPAWRKPWLGKGTVLARQHALSVLRGSQGQYWLRNRCACWNALVNSLASKEID